MGGRIILKMSLKKVFVHLVHGQDRIQWRAVVNRFEAMPNGVPFYRTQWRAVINTEHGIR